jgi:hypothetical protein
MKKITKFGGSNTYLSIWFSGPGTPIGIVSSYSYEVLIYIINAWWQNHFKGQEKRAFAL